MKLKMDYLYIVGNLLQVPTCSPNILLGNHKRSYSVTSGHYSQQLASIICFVAWLCLQFKGGLPVCACTQAFVQIWKKIRKNKSTIYYLTIYNEWLATLISIWKRKLFTTTVFRGFLTSLLLHRVRGLCPWMWCLSACQMCWVAAFGPLMNQGVTGW